MLLNGSALNELEIVQYLESVLGAVAKPKGFLYVATIPMIGVGKVDRRALTDMVGEQGIGL